MLDMTEAVKLWIKGSDVLHRYILYAINFYIVINPVWFYEWRIPFNINVAWLYVNKITVYTSKSIVFDSKLIWYVWLVS